MKGTDESMDRIELVSTSRFDRAIEWLLIGMLAFMPLALGARAAWGLQIVILLTSLIVVTFFIKLICEPQCGFVWSGLYVPVCVFVGLVVFQQVSLPAGFISVVSPGTTQLRAELLDGLPRSQELLNRQTVSLYPHATRYKLGLLLSAAAVFFVVVNVYRQSDQIKRLLLAIALIAGLVGLIAVAQNIFGNGLRYWFVPNPPTGGSDRTLSGPFLNRNHFGQYMNLSIGAAVAWLCVTLHSDFSGKKIAPDWVIEYLGSKKATLVWLVTGIIALCTASVFLSLTRGGMISILIAGFVTAMIICLQRSTTKVGWIMLLVALLAFSCVLFIGFESVYDRFATATRFEGFEYRAQTLKDLVAAYIQFPVLGTGLGTHSVVYPMYQNIYTYSLFTHAENEYAQALEETGIVGLMTLAAFGAGIFVAYLKCVRKDSRINCAAYGIGLGLLAILIHSISDYGQRIPANAMLSVVFCGLLVVLSRKKRIVHFKNMRLLAPIAMICAGGLFSWALYGAQNARIAQRYWNRAAALENTIKPKNYHADDQTFAQLVGYAEKASSREPENSRYKYALNLYRWHQLDQKEGPKDTERVQHIVSGLHEAIFSSPTFGPAYSLAGQIEKFVLFQDSGADRIRTGYRLAPSSGIASFTAARLDLLEGNIDASIEKFDTAVKIDRTLFRDVAEIYIHQISRPHLAIRLAEGDAHRLRVVARLLGQMQYDDLAEQALLQAEKVLTEKFAADRISASELIWLANIYKDKSDIENAIACYSRAIQMDYGQVRWRYERAVLLAKSGRVAEALNEARMCLRLRPQFDAAARLVAELSVEAQNPGGH